MNRKPLISITNGKGIRNGNIKLFITELLKLYPNDMDKVLFSKIIVNGNLEEAELLAQSLTLLIEKIDYSKRRTTTTGQHAFNSLFDDIKRILKLILSDALEHIKFDTRPPFLTVLLRRILQLDIGPDLDHMIIINDENEDYFLKMDLDSQCGSVRYDINLSQIEFDKTNELQLELDKRTIFIYCTKFHVADFPISGVIIQDDLLIGLFFKKYFTIERLQSILQYNEHEMMKSITFLNGLKGLTLIQWIELPVDLILQIISISITETQILDMKQLSIIFEIFALITQSLKLRPVDTRTTDFNNEVVIEKLKSALKNNINTNSVTQFSDVCLSKFWFFVSTLLEEEIELGAEEDIENLVEMILITLTSEEIGDKAKIAVCRVIALLSCTRLKNMTEILSKYLLQLLFKTHNNKLKWNISITLQAFQLENNLIDEVELKEFWLSQLQKMENFKVTSSVTDLLLKVQNHNLTLTLIESDIQIIRLAQKYLTGFIFDNEKSIEIDESNEFILQSASKLKNQIDYLLDESDWSNEKSLNWQVG